SSTSKGPTPRASPKLPASPRATWPRRFIASRRFWPAVLAKESAMKNDDVVEIWQTQSRDGFRMRTEDIRKRIETLNRKLRRRTIDGYLVCATLIAVFA